MPFGASNQTVLVLFSLDTPSARVWRGRIVIINLRDNYWKTSFWTCGAISCIVGDRLHTRNCDTSSRNIFLATASMFCLANSVLCAETKLGCLDFQRFNDRHPAFKKITHTKAPPLDLFKKKNLCMSRVGVHTHAPHPPASFLPA